MFKFTILSGLLLLVIASGCTTPEYIRHATYFQDSVTEAEKNLANNPVIIKPGDKLGIAITAVNKEAADAFNNTAIGVTGYLVDSSGNIQLLQLGVMPVAGYTPAQLKDTIQQRLENYIKGPLVNVSIINFQVNMMGEVGHPGVLTVPDGKINILQAITQSGDITQYGLRQNILVIREVDGRREFGRIDISSNHVFESPYFYLQQNDIVYVEPVKAKFNDIAISKGIRNIGFATGVISVVLLIVNLAIK